MDHLEPAHLVCVLITLERCLIEVHLEWALALRAGDFTTPPHLDALRQLLIACRAGICAKTRSLPECELPPLLPLLARLPAHMQMQLEQAIEAERWGQATHHPCVVSAEQVRGEMQRHAILAAQRRQLQSGG